MDKNHDNVMEKQLRKAMRKVAKQLLKNIDKEPILIVESGDSECNVSEETISGIGEWLFRER
jgi:hypothetical protein